ncbi:MAG: hypothetical protein Q9183_005486, partial [Haloplaca sp. 2 TL-2023]
MASVKKFWDELAYPIIWLNHCGRPAILKEDLEEFAHQYSPTEQIPRLARIYLNLKGVNVVHQKEGRPQVCQDCEKTQRLVMKAFRLVRDATNDVAAEANEVLSQAPAPSVSSGQIPVDNQVNEPSLAKPQPKIGTAGPAAPISSHTKMEIVALVNKWIQAHPNLRVPVLASYDKIQFQNVFGTEATTTENGERVWILRLGIVDLYQGWVLEKGDGTCTLVKAHYTRKNGHAYHPWIGGEGFAFADHIIADHKVVERKIISIHRYAKIKGLDPEDVLNEYDISKAALEYSSSEKPQAEVIDLQGDDSDSPLGSLPDAESVNNTSKKRTFSTRSQASRVLPDSDSDSSEPLAQKKARRPSLKLNVSRRTPDSKDLGHDVPSTNTSLPVHGVLKPQPDASGPQSLMTPSRTSKNQNQALGPPITPQHSMSPTAYPTPQTSQHPLESPNRIRRNGKESNSISPSGNYTLLNPNGSLYTGPTPYANANVIPNSLGAQPNPPLPISNANNASHDANVPSTAQHPGSQSFAPRHANSNAKPGQIKFHYYLSNPNDGAIPHTYSALPTKETFFRHATAAYNLTRGP